VTNLGVIFKTREIVGMHQAGQLKKKYGARKIYRQRWDLGALPSQYLKESTSYEQYRCEYYQIQALSKAIKSIPLNVVVKTIRLKDTKESIKLFFSLALLIGNSFFNQYSLSAQKH